MLLLACALSFARPALAGAQEVPTDPRWACVRIPSHGCSGTVIATGQDYSFILTCAHAFQGNARYRKVSIGVPCAVASPPAHAVGVTVLRVDYARDLTLLKLSAGPLPYCCPVAQTLPTHKGCWSCGYAQMVRPALAKGATVLAVDPGVSYTDTRPIPGMSGGGLVDVVTRQLVGVTIGYEVAQGGRGMYVALGAVRTFLGLPGAAEPALQPLGVGGCPGGVCPFHAALYLGGTTDD